MSEWVIHFLNRRETEDEGLSTKKVLGGGKSLEIVKMERGGGGADTLWFNPQVCSQFPLIKSIDKDNSLRS